MTVIHQEFGYLEDEYLDFLPYLTGHTHGHMGFQTTAVIEDDNPIGFQAEGQIVDFQNNLGFQVATITIDFLDPDGYQATATIEDDDPIGFQSQAQIVDFLDPQGLQAEGNIQDFLDEIGSQANAVIESQDEIGAQAAAQIIDFEDAEGVQATAQIAATTDEMGFQVRQDSSMVHLTHGKYLTESYLTTSYLADLFCLIMGFQAEAIIDEETALGFEVNGGTEDFPVALGFQASTQILDFLDEKGFQAEAVIEDFLNELGFQSQGIIEESLELGFQAELQIDDDVFLGFQAESVSIELVGMQVRSAIYNSENFRILCEFPSRGVTVNNWTANFQATGDFDVNNVNTDIEEQVWRSASGVKTGIQLGCDTGVVQGVAVDTVFISGTNLTTSATVTLNGSNSPIYATIDRTITLVPLDNGRMYHISADLPLTSQRYWRLDIDDPTNTEDPEIGIILFGAAQIFSGECIVDQIGFQQRDFTKAVRTEGHTNVTVSRSQKRIVTLEFRDLDADLGNYSLMRDIFEEFRTTLKCLYIPTPDPTRQNITDRYAVFAKMTEVPVEQHNNKGPTNTHVSFSLNLDESL